MKKRLALTFLFFPIFALADADLPLKPTRTIEFTTREGTLMSLDVSPDGETIIFDLLGDLYTLPIAGGTAVPLTEGIAWDEAPRFSPDGRHVAFTSDRSGTDNIWVIDTPGGVPRNVTQETQVARLTTPQWTPDGRALIARRLAGSHPTPQLWRYDMTTAVGTLLADERVDRGGGALTPDGSALVMPDTAGFRILDLRSRKEVELALHEGEKGLHLPRVSPDGRWLLYAADLARDFGHLFMRQNEVRLLDLTARRSDPSRLASKVIASPAQFTPMGSSSHAVSTSVAQGYAFTPDSQSVVFAQQGELKRMDLATRNVTDIPFAAHVRASLGPLAQFATPLSDAPFVARQLRSIHRSPDGKRFAFSALGKVWTQNEKGTPRRLTAQQSVNEFDPAFSPGGRWIAFVTWSDAEGGQLVKMPAEGGPMTILARGPGAYLTPRWTSDGARIVFVAEERRDEQRLMLRARENARAFQQKIHWIAAEGGQIRTLETSIPIFALWEEANPAIALSGDGERVYFTSTPAVYSGGVDLLLRAVRLDGRQECVIATVDRAHEGKVSQLAPSPDGRWLAIGSDFNIFLRQAPPAAESCGSQDSAPQWSFAGAQADAEVLPVTTTGGVAPYWSADGEWLNWTWMNRHFRARLEDLLAARGAGNAEAETQIDEITLRAPRRQPAGRLLLRGARLVTLAAKGVKRMKTADGHVRVVTDAMVIERGDLLIDGRRIEAIGPMGSFAVPAETTVMDMAGKTIIPGLIDMDVHLGFLSHPIMPQQNWVFAAHLAHGVTTARSPLQGYLLLHDEEAIEAEAGGVVGPRMVSGLPLPSWALYGAEAIGLDNVLHREDQQRLLRTYKQAGAGILKTSQDDPGYGKFDSRKFASRGERQRFVMVAADENLLVTSHQHDVKQMLRMALDGHSGAIHAASADALRHDVTGLFGQAGTSYAPGPFTHSTYLRYYRDAALIPRNSSFWPPRYIAHKFPTAVARVVDENLNFDEETLRVARGAAQALHAGMNVSAATDGPLLGWQGFGLHTYIWAYAEAGMTPAEALRCVTLNGAHELGLDRDLGSIEVGKIADLVVLNDNPLVDIRSTTDIKYVVKDGVVYEGRTLDEVWPVKKRFPRFPWQSD